MNTAAEDAEEARRLHWCGMAPPLEPVHHNERVGKPRPYKGGRGSALLCGLCGCVL